MDQLLVEITKKVKEAFEEAGYPYRSVFTMDRAINIKCIPFSKFTLDTLKGSFACVGHTRSVFAVFDGDDFTPIAKGFYKALDASPEELEEGLLSD